MKISLDRLNNADITDKKISGFKDTAIEIIQIETLGEKDQKKEQNVNNL